MTKKLLAAALSSAIVAPAALADVQIYGVASVGVEHVRATGAKNTPDAQQYEGRIRIADETSRIGFKGAEDLGNGLKAYWQIEQGVSLEDTNGKNKTFANRTSYIALGGGFGDIRLGRHEDAYRVALSRVGLDLFSSTSASNHWGNKAMFGRTGGRRNNTMIYLSPQFSGVQAYVSYSADEERKYDGAERTNAAVYGFGANYIANGLKASVGYNHLNDIASVRERKIDSWALAAAYNFGDTTVGAGYEHVAVKLGKNIDTMKQHAATLTVAHKIGATTLKAAYTAQGKLKNAGGNTSDLYKANQWQLGVDYNLSKRTQVQAFASRITNKEMANMNFAVNGLPVVKAGSDPQVVGVALKHTF